jgi:hypothetical protein
MTFDSLFLPLGTMMFTYAMMAVTVIGGAVGAVATYRQGKEAQRVANMNADLANQEARQQLAIGKMQEHIAMQQAAAERAAMMAEAAATRMNATAMDQETVANEARSREEQRRAREEARQRLAETGSIFAGAGVVSSTGTPLAVMASSVMLEESNVIDMQYLTNVESTKSRWEANVERATAGRMEGTANAQFAISKNAAKVSGLATQIGARNKMTQAEIERSAGRAARRNANLAAVAGGISTVGAAAGTYAAGSAYRSTAGTYKGGSSGGGSGRNVSARPSGF